MSLFKYLAKVSVVTIICQAAQPSYSYSPSMNHTYDFEADFADLSMLDEDDDYDDISDYEHHAANNYLKHAALLQHPMNESTGKIQRSEIQLLIQKNKDNLISSGIHRNTFKLDTFVQKYR